MDLPLAARQFLDTAIARSGRDARLLERAVRTLCTNEWTSSHFPWHPFRGIIPARQLYEGVWNWDAAFHALTVYRWDPDLARDQARIFIENQREDGGFIDVLFANGEIVRSFGKPPVFPWAMWIVHERAPDVAFLKQVYPAFVRLEDHWRRYRLRDDLFHFDTDNRGENWLTQVKYESGWDNSVRWDQGIVELFPVDLNAYMVMFYQAMARIAETLQLDSTVWKDKEAALAHQIEQRLFDTDSNCYCDLNGDTGRFSTALSPSAFVPLYAGISSLNHAEAMASLARSSDFFYPGMPTISYNNPEYSRNMWRGPCWMNTAYFAIRGLERYGYSELASEIRNTVLDWCDAEDELREYYDAKTGEGLGARGFGWTAAFIIELVLGDES